MSEIRLNLITGDWVIISSERGQRPHDFREDRVREPRPEHVATCPFCPGNEEKTPGEVLRISGPDQQWQIRAVPNKFSVLSPTAEMTRIHDGFHNQVGGFGLHEVIIESPRHDLTTALYTTKQIEHILTAYRQRFLAFYEDPRIKHVIVYKNHGPAAGTSLAHPHSQIVGTPVTPGQIRARLESARRFHDEFGECLYCWTMHQELEDGCRIVLETELFTVFVPYAALSPYHLWVFPKRHQACFGRISESEIHELARILQEILGKLRHGLGDPDFNYVIRSLSPGEDRTEHFHWYVAIVPRLSKAAGFELGTGMYINSAEPSSSAAFLRDMPWPAP